MWTNWPGKRNEIVAEATGTIHPGMVEILERAGAEGVSWQDLQNFPWRRDSALVDAALIEKAIGEIARHYGYPIQYVGSRGGGQHPTRYRIASWNHAARLGTPTSQTDFPSIA